MYGALKKSPLLLEKNDFPPLLMITQDYVGSI